MPVCLCCVCKDRSTPLHWPLYEEHVEVTCLLLDRGANIEAIDRVSAIDPNDIIRSLHLLYDIFYVSFFLYCVC